MRAARMRVLPGKPYPLGATFGGEGTNFALYSENATGVEPYLVEQNGDEKRVPVRQRTGPTWHCYLPIVKPDQRHGLRVHGPTSRNEACDTIQTTSSSIHTPRRSIAYRFGKKESLRTSWAAGTRIS